MLLTAELAALNLDPAQQEGVVAAVLPLHAEAEKLRAQAKLDTLKIQALTLELAHLRRIRFGVKNEALSPEQRDLFRETADADSASIEAEVEQQLPELRRGQPPGQSAGDLAFHYPPCIEDVCRIRPRRRRHLRAAVVVQRDHLVLRQPVQRLPDHRARDGEARGQFLLAQPRAGGQAAL